MNLKVIFTATVKNVALRGDIKNVSEGYFRNYLLPRKLAIHATGGALAAWEAKRKDLMIERENILQQFEEMKRRLAGNKIVIEKKVTTKGTLYGGIKTADIVKALKDSMKINIDPTSIIIPDHIKAVGTYSIMVQLGEGVEAHLDIDVVKK